MILRDAWQKLGLRFLVSQIAHIDVLSGLYPLLRAEKKCGKRNLTVFGSLFSGIFEIRPRLASYGLVGNCPEMS